MTVTVPDCRSRTHLSRPHHSCSGPVGERPPVTQSDWEAEFTKYKASPEYKKVRSRGGRVVLRCAGPRAGRNGGRGAFASVP